MGINKYNCGIYSITSPSGKQYIGSSVNLKKRWLHHKSCLRNNKHTNSILQHAWEKYGDRLQFKTLIICEPKDLLFYEQLLLDAWKPEYNICSIAGNTTGVKRSVETIEKQRKSITGYRHTEEAKEKIRVWHLGRKRLPETVAKFTATLTGLARPPHTEATKLKIGLANKKAWAKRKEINL